MGYIGFESYYAAIRLVPRQRHQHGLLDAKATSSILSCCHLIFIDILSLISIPRHPLLRSCHITHFRCHATLTIVAIMPHHHHISTIVMHHQYNITATRSLMLEDMYSPTLYEDPCVISMFTFSLWFGRMVGCTPTHTQCTLRMS